MWKGNGVAQGSRERQLQLYFSFGVRVSKISFFFSNMKFSSFANQARRPMGFTNVKRGALPKFQSALHSFWASAEGQGLCQVFGGTELSKSWSLRSCSALKAGTQTSERPDSKTCCDKCYLRSVEETGHTTGNSLSQA